MIVAKLSRIYREFACQFFLAVAAISILVPMSVLAQAIPAASSSPPWSRFELYGGYAYLNAPDSSTNSYKNQPQLSGFSFSGADFLDHYLGIQGQADFFPSSPDNSILRTEAGPMLRFPMGEVVPSLHVLAGAVRAAGPQSQSQTWGVAVTAGAAVDYVLPKFGTHFSLRLVEVDFDYSHITYGPPMDARVTGFLSQLSAGVVYRSGETEPRRPIQMGCTANAVEVFPGEPITITAHLLEEDPKRVADFRWSSSGGHPEGTGNVVRLDTRAISPGDYVVTGTVQQGRKVNTAAHCAVEFRVLKFEPPTLSCSADPALVVQGGEVAIHATARSPQNRALTYDYSASSGVVSGTGADVILNTSGVPPGEIQIVCRTTDDLSQQAKANLTIRTVLPEKSKPVPLSPICPVIFGSEKQTATQLNGAARDCLEQIAAALLKQPTMNLILFARHVEDELPDIASLRALNAAEYLIHERNIDPSRVKMLSGGGYGHEVDSYLIDQNEKFLPGDAVTIDASSLTRHTPLYTKPSGNPNATKPKF